MADFLTNPGHTSTYRASADLGFRAVLVADAHTCMDTPALSAERIIRHHNATLDGPFATLTTTAVCTF
ncbi:hypothetical protein [Burkholderia stagnalis]|uniref:hypothetical protein n=1 Tax=Burkholderia stagnalis TaxID=1503054 RepID=UPI00075E65BE|nr:hypothetical protein WT05_07740 [Burkholderia stagnalis]